MRRAYDALGITCPPTTNTSIIPNSVAGRVKMSGQTMQLPSGSVTNIRLSQPQNQGNLEK